MMGLHSLLGTSGDRSQPKRSKSSGAASAIAPASASSSSETLDVIYIHDHEQLQPLPQECPDLRELNNSLEALAAVFPDVQVEVFREMLANFDGESRCAVVADALLKNRVNWVKGRWRLADQRREADKARIEARENHPQDSDSDLVRTIPPKDAFKSDGYKDAVKALAWQEFRGLSRSTIHAVLAEHNYAYLEARKTLVELSSRSWRFTLSTFFSRRKPVTTGEAENHPLITWKSSGQGSIIPTIKGTGHAEFDRELYDDLIRPLKEQAKQSQEEKDRGLAVILNTEEAESVGAMHECCCCFTEATFEEFTQCNADGHMICFRCVRLSVTEAVFGQGWQSSIDTESGTLKCLAVDGGGCSGCVPAHHLHRAMLEERKGAEILHKLDQRLAEHSLLSSNLPLIRCPFCDYAEVDDIYLPRHEARLRLRIESLFNLFFLVLCIFTVPFLLPLVLFASIFALLFAAHLSANNRLGPEWSLALHRLRRRRRGPKFTCLNPSCARASCLSCHKSWTDIHVCNESSLVALRTQVEQAMSLAIKRVCPRCATSFVKNAGCNKLTCPCGYKMCYVCRSDIGDEGYRHYCDHFRPDGDPSPCTQCDRCNLWETEDTEAVLRAAREEAERRWMATEKKELGGSEREFLETGFAGARQGGAAVVDRLVRRRRLPTVGEICDMVVTTLFVV